MATPSTRSPLLHRFGWSCLLGVALLAGAPTPSLAQSNSPAIDSDLVKSASPIAKPHAAVVQHGQSNQPYPSTPDPTANARYVNDDPPLAGPRAPCVDRKTTGTTYSQDDLIGAAEGVFGTGARGLANIIQDIIGKQGRPTAYISGREAGGALVVGLRYGSGTLCHKIQGHRKIWWTGPSVGFDAGGSAGKTFVLVYNLTDNEDIYHRFVAGEGQAYLVGGFHVSYLRKGRVVLIPVRMGVGLRLGLNAGYMKISRKQKWLPF